MTWLEQYQAELRDIAARVGPIKNQANYASTLFNVVNAQGTPGLFQPAPIQAAAQDPVDNRSWIEKAFTGFNQGVSNAVSVPLDWLTRLGSATTTAADELYNQSVPGSENDIGKILEAGRKGFFHEDGQKTGYDLVTRPDTGLLSQAPDWIKAVGGFGVDVALDPLSYVGPGAVSKVAKVTGLNKLVEGAKAGAVQNVTKTVSSPIEQNAEILNKVGAVKVPSNLVEPVIKKQSSFPASGGPLKTTEAASVSPEQASMPFLDLQADARRLFADTFPKSAENPTGLLKQVVDTNFYVEQALKQAGKTADPAEKSLAKDVLNNVVAEQVPYAEMRVAARVANDVAKATTNTERLKAVGNGFASSLREVDQMKLEDIHDFSERLALAQGVNTLRMWFPHIANEDIRPLLLSERNTAQAMAYAYTKELNKINRQYPQEMLQDAFRRVQLNQVDQISDPMTRQAATAIKKMVDSVWNIDDDLGILNRLGISTDQINSKMAHFGIPQKYRLVGVERKTALNNWRAWTDVEDPLDLLARAYGAAMYAHADNQLGAALSRFGSKVPQEGYHRIVDSAGKSRVASLIDKDLYYPDDIAKQMRVLDTTLEELSKPASMNKLLNTMDAVLHVYKGALTIYRPGHHLRNAMGDTWLGFASGLTDPRHYRDALKVMATRRADYEHWDPTAAAQITPNIGKPLLKFTYNGKPVTLNAEDTRRLMETHGTLTHYSVITDLNVNPHNAIDLTRSGISGNLSKVNPLKWVGQAGKAHDIAAGTAEFENHFFRSAQFLYEMRKVKTLHGKTLEEAINNAAETAAQQTRRWHPDGSDLSKFEREGMRRVVLFYSWLRKAMPLVITSAVMRPGRFTAYPKAMANIAQANGIDINGLNDPFPADQLFPSFLRNSTQGPIMGQADAYFGIRPGLPGPDILDQYFNTGDPASVVQNVAGGVNPFLKVPAEIAAGVGQGNFAQDFRTGTPVENPMDYFFKQVPNSNYLEAMLGSRVPGRSPEAKSNKGYEPQFNVGPVTLDRRGISAANWLTGLGITDFSKPSYKTTARIERQQALKDKKKH